MVHVGTMLLPYTLDLWVYLDFQLLKFSLWYSKFASFNELAAWRHLFALSAEKEVTLRWIKEKSWCLWKYLQCSETGWLIKKKKKIESLANVSFLAVWLAAAGLSTPSPPYSSCGSDSFEGQSQWEWDGPSDEHWLLSISVGFHSLCRLITLQSSTGALRAVNYFAEQRGDVPSCERQRERETETK